MAWKKRFNSLLHLLPFPLHQHLYMLMLLLFAFKIPLQAQDSLWTENEWKEVKKEYVYENPNEPKKETENFDFDIPEDTSNWDIYISDTARMVILVSFIIILSALLIYFFWGNGQKNAKIHNPDLNMNELEMNLDKIDPDQFLSKVLEGSDYKTAVRLLFLSTLRQLHLIKWIHWKKDKTNYDFLREMRTREQYKAFRELTLAFEIVWYGDTSISESQYRRIKEKYDSLIQTLPNEK